MLLVTHDVDEAIVLADRVLVLDSGRIAAEQLIDVDLPRNSADPRFAEIRAHLLDALGVTGERNRN
ncbi:hypothetical protein ACFQX6_44410 [Streptosporangium lutulentum]